MFLSPKWYSDVFHWSKARCSLVQNLASSDIYLHFNNASGVPKWHVINCFFIFSGNIIDLCLKYSLVEYCIVQKDIYLNIPDKKILVE